ncbi:MAG: hypothetical protein WHS87_09440 [Anaerolineales bacterium]
MAYGEGEGEMRGEKGDGRAGEREKRRGEMGEGERRKESGRGEKGEHESGRWRAGEGRRERVRVRAEEGRGRRLGGRFVFRVANKGRWVKG